MNASRRYPLAVLGAAVVVALGSSTAVAVHRTAGRGDSAVAVVAGAAPESAPTTAALARAALSTGPATAAAAQPAPAVAGAAPTTGAAGRRSGLSVALHLRQRTVVVGELVEADLGVDDDDGIPAEYVLDWGDGRTAPNRPAAQCGGTTTAPQQGRPTHWSNRVEYSYRMPGTYTVLYRVRTQTCGVTGVEEQVARGVVTVLDGPLPTNGGRRPRAFLSSSSHGATPRGTVVEVQGQDLDGWVTQMIVDLGDGTPARLVENPAACVSARGEWPTTPFFAHRYDAPYRMAGTYTVTLTVFTAGCDGRDVQQTTVRQQVVVPAPVA